MSSKYAAAHVDSKGPGDARPTALQIIQDNELEGKLKDKTMIITGCSSGIGIETARALSTTGAKLYLGVRDIAKGESTLHNILETGRVELLKMDLNSLDSIRAAVKDFQERNKSRGLNVLICNAGIMAVPTLTHTADGFESQFGTNHLGHFLLFNLLKDTLLTSSTPEFNSRVVTLASSGHRAGGIRVDDYNFTEPDSYNPWSAYGQSKTANIYMSSYIDRNFGPKGLHANAVMPGGIWTPLQKHMEAAALEAFKADPEVHKVMKSPEQGAATTVWAAVAKEWEGKGGKYLENCQISEPAKGTARTDPGYAPHAYNVELEDRLWVDSLKMVGL